MAIDPQTLSYRGRLVHLVHSRQFTRPLLEDIFDVADAARLLNTSRPGSVYLQKSLVGRRALLYFTQPSTRTFLSFQAAAAMLGMSTSEVRNPDISSEVKGESALDTVRTYAMYHDLIIIRYERPGFSEECARHFIDHDLHRHIINGGSGQDDHPTQALLDIYTLHREFYNRGGIDGKRIMLVGDLARGRAARSLLLLLALYDNVKVDLVSPSELKMKEDILRLVRKKDSEKRGLSEVWEGEQIDCRLGEADAVYMTRVQWEYDSEDFSPRVDKSSYALDQSRYGQLKPNAIVMHPLPRQDEIPTELDGDPRSRYWEQVENGMWARAGLIAHILGCDAYVKSG
jgi:aspartate carbamoyltransferase catalytic subunit